MTSLLLLVFSFLSSSPYLFPIVRAQSPPPNYQGTASFVGSSLYYIGGRNSSYTGFSGSYTLDLKSSFDLVSSPWRALTSLPYSLSECPSWVFSNNIWLEGGINGGVQDDNQMTNGSSPLPNDVIMFDTASGNWSAPSIASRPFNQRRLHAAVVNDTAQMVYVVGGASDIYSGTPSSVCNSQTGSNCLQGTPYRLDLTKMIWAPLSEVGAPLVWRHAMVLVKSNLYVIGGDGNGASLERIPTYNTVANSWSSTITSGSSPSNRSGCSATLHSDGKTIFMYGGLVNNVPSAELWSFDTEKSVWTSIPVINGVAVAFHAAIQLDDLLFVLFGSTAQSSTLEGSSTFLLLNTTSGNLLTSYAPTTYIINHASSIPTSASNSNSNSTSTSTSTSISTSTSSTIVDSLSSSNSPPLSRVIAIASCALILLIAIGLLLCRRVYRRRHLDPSYSSFTPSVSVKHAPRGPPVPPPHDPEAIAMNSSHPDYLLPTTQEYKPNEHIYKPNEHNFLPDELDITQVNKEAIDEGVVVSLGKAGGKSVRHVSWGREGEVVGKRSGEIIGRWARDNMGMPAGGGGTRVDDYEGSR